MLNSANNKLFWPLFWETCNYALDSVEFWAFFYTDKKSGSDVFDRKNIRLIKSTSAKFWDLLDILRPDCSIARESAS